MTYARLALAKQTRFSIQYSIQLLTLIFSSWHMSSSDDRCMATPQSYYVRYSLLLRLCFVLPLAVRSSTFVRVSSRSIRSVMRI
jgi:hypothetical protein